MAAKSTKDVASSEYLTFAGSSLEPEPPVGSKDPNTRYLHIGPGFDVDEAQLVRWIEQAAALPGWMGF